MKYYTILIPCNSYNHW